MSIEAKDTAPAACRVCESEIPPGSPRGLCPSCLFAGGLGPFDEAAKRLRTCRGDLFIAQLSESGQMGGRFAALFEERLVSGQLVVVRMIIFRRLSLISGQTGPFAKDRCMELRHFIRRLDVRRGRMDRIDIPALCISRSSDHVT